LARLHRHLRLQQLRTKEKRIIGGKSNVYNRRIFSLIFVLFLLASIINLSSTGAFFTTGVPIESDGLSFLIKEQQNREDTGVNLSIKRPFLFEEEEVAMDGSEEEIAADNNIAGSRILATESEGLPEQSSNNVKQPSPGETVEAEIVIADFDFNVEDIFIPSVRLHYGDKSSFILSGEIEESSLVATFNLYEIWSWFQELLPLPEQVTLTVTGEGYQLDGSIFFFSGKVLIPLTGTYDVRAVEIVSPEVMFILEGEALVHELVLVDQDGLPLEGASWKLVEPGEGISLDDKTGLLTAGYTAVGEKITVEATLESQGRLHTAQAIIQFQIYPQLQIVGPESITLPPPGESIRQSYELFSEQSLEPADVSWAITPSMEGVKVDEDGMVTVYGGAGAGSFTLTARCKILGHPFNLEKEIELVNIPIGFVVIEGNNHIIIPDKEAVNAAYTATVFSPNGNIIDNENVSWHLEAGSTSGLQLTADGLLTVGPHAVPGQVTLVSVSVRDPAVKGTMQVTLEALSEVKPEPEPDPETEEDSISDEKNQPEVIPQPEEDEGVLEDQEKDDSVETEKDTDKANEETALIEKQLARIKLASLI